MTHSHLTRYAQWRLSIAGRDCRRYYNRLLQTALSPLHRVGEELPLEILVGEDMVATLGEFHRNKMLFEFLYPTTNRVVFDDLDGYVENALRRYVDSGFALAPSTLTVGFIPLRSHHGRVLDGQIDIPFLDLGRIELRDESLSVSDRVVYEHPHYGWCIGNGSVIYSNEL